MTLGETKGPRVLSKSQKATLFASNWLACNLDFPAISPMPYKPHTLESVDCLPTESFSETLASDKFPVQMRRLTAFVTF